MIIKQTKYKDVLAFQLITKKNTALVLPTEGGKIASFKNNQTGKEYLLQNTSKTYNKLGMDGSFEKGECSAFDDMFPTIDEVEVTLKNGKKVIYPDHGEICRVTFDYKTENETLCLHYLSNLVGYRYEKVFSEGKDGELVLSYKITNLNTFGIDVLWTAHCLINVENGGELLLPFDDGEPMDLLSDNIYKEKAGNRIDYSDAYRVSKWQDGVTEMRKFYFPREPKEGFVAYKYPSGDVFRMEFDPNILKSIGIWVNYGRLNNDYCIGLEPCTVGYDTVLNAQKRGYETLLGGGECLTFDVSIKVE